MMDKNSLKKMMPTFAAAFKTAIQLLASLRTVEVYGYKDLIKDITALKQTHPEAKSAYVKRDSEGTTWSLTLVLLDADKQILKDKKGTAAGVKFRLNQFDEELNSLFGNEDDLFIK